jgi:hypothetical protein
VTEEALVDGEADLCAVDLTLPRFTVSGLVLPL